MPSPILEYVQPRALKLSPSGRFVFLRTRRANIEENQYERSRRILSTNPDEAPPRLDLPAQARSVRWGTEERQLAYRAPGEKTTQVWIKYLDSDSSRRLTHADKAVESFKLSPEGDRVAYTVRRTTNSEASSSDSLRGVEIDLTTFMMWDLQGDLPSTPSPQTITELWVRDLEAGTTRKISGPLSISDFTWSPSGNRIAITGVPSSRMAKQHPGVRLHRRDLYIYDRTRGDLRRIHQGRQDSLSVFDGTVLYTDPFWSPSGRQLAFERVDRSDRFARTPTLGIYDLETDDTRYVTSDAPEDLADSRYYWVSPDRLLVEYLDHAERGLYRLSLHDGRTEPIWTPDGEAKGFSFSADGRRAVWVQGSIEQPPEIYTGERPFEAPRKVSSLNDHLAGQRLPNAESVTWISTDGTRVEGWLLTSETRASSSPRPLVVFVHGGPTAAMRNQFFINDSWPFPFRALAHRGYAVFIPNYRHSESFGKEFLRVSALDAEPVDDILTGIDHLAEQGVADTTRMAIMGNSHGGWLGPLVAAERPTFEAASFAEGIRANYITTYGRGAGWMAEDLTQYLFDASPYENLNRSAELSPALRHEFTKTTPTLLEFGKKAATVNGGIELGRAFWHHDTPHELVIYPELGHVNRRPETMLESMNRTLDWIERWIPTDPSSAAVAN